MLIVRLLKCTFQRAPTAMSNLDNFRPDDESVEPDDNSESVTYVEISSVDHPNAYGHLAQGGAIRRNAPVNDLYAAITENLAAVFTDGDKLPLLRWLLVNDDGELDRDTLEQLIEEHSDE